MITRAMLEAKAEQCGFRVIGYQPGPGSSMDISIKDEVLNDRKEVISGGGQGALLRVWPDTTETELFTLFATAAQETRGGGFAEGTASDWMM